MLRCLRLCHNRSHSELKDLNVQSPTFPTMTGAAAFSRFRWNSSRPRNSLGDRELIHELEPVLKRFEDSEQAAELPEALEEVRVVFPACGQSS